MFSLLRISTGEALGWTLALIFHGFCVCFSLANDAFLWDDSVQYLTLADNLRRFGEFSQSYSPPLSPDTQRLPGYPLFLLLCGCVPFVVILVQHLLVGLTAFFIYRILKAKLTPTTARYAALFYCLTPYPALFASIFLTETLFIFLLVWSFERLLFSLTAKNGWAFLCATALLSVSVYAKTLSYYLIPIYAIAGLSLLFSGRPRVGAYVISLIIPFALLQPWLLRNERLLGEKTLSTLGQSSLWYGRLGGLVALETEQPLDDRTLFRAADSVGSLLVGAENVWIYPNGRRSQETAQLTPKLRRYPYQYFAERPLLAIKFQLICLKQMFQGIGYRTALGLSYSQRFAIVSAGVQGLANISLVFGLILSFIYFKRLKQYQRLALIAAAWLLILHSAAWSDGRYRMAADALIIVGVWELFPTFLARFRINNYNIKSNPPE